MTSEPPSPHIEAARRRLAHLGGLAAQTEEAERRILTSATDRLAVVREELDKLRPRAIADHAAGDRYLALTQERGQLETVIAQAQQVLGQ
jgi:hypothetical protein